jgi:hypothetical protein
MQKNYVNNHNKNQKFSTVANITSSFSKVCKKTFFKKTPLEKTASVHSAKNKKPVKTCIFLPKSAGFRAVNRD